jgi:predicted phosphate transport protein (TIGR00153 family)
MFGSKKKDAAFFSAFSDHASKSVEASKMLMEMFKALRVSDDAAKTMYRPDTAPPGEVAKTTIDLAGKIKQAETAGDTITHQTVKRLHENWITPLDRDDIHGLITRMDDVLDFIEAVSERIILFKVTVAPHDAIELTEILVRSCEALTKAVALLPTMSKAPEILSLCVEVNRLENEADQVYRRAIAELFTAGNDPLMVMKWRDIFDGLESATDRCEDVANIVEGVVLEYA